MSMSKAIQAKSDQLNADDLIGLDYKLIKIREVNVNDSEQQKVWIYYEGDNGKPWKSNKSMNKVLVACWGEDESTYTARYVKIHRDPSVVYAGEEVGGIVILGLSHIDHDMKVSVNAKRSKKRVYPIAKITDQEILICETEIHAKKGVEAFTAFGKTLTKEQKELIGDDNIKRCMVIAKEVK